MINSFRTSSFLLHLLLLSSLPFVVVFKPVEYSFAGRWLAIAAGVKAYNRTCEIDAALASIYSCFLYLANWLERMLVFSKIELIF